MAQLTGLEEYLQNPVRSEMSPEQLLALQEQLNANSGKVMNMKKDALMPLPNGELAVQQRNISQVQRPVSQVDEYRALMSKLEAQNAEAMNAQQAGIEQQAQNINDFKKSGDGITNTNWSPLMAWFDAGNKTNMVASYKPPQTQEEKQKQIIELEQALQKSRGEMSQREIDNTKALLNAALVNKNIGQTGRDLRFAASQQRAMEKDIGTDVTKLSDELGEENQQFDVLESNLGSGEYQKVMNSLSNFSRKVSGEKGVLTDTDIARVLPKNFQGSLAKFEEYFRTTDPTQVDPNYTKSLVELTQLAKSKTNQRFLNNLEQRETRWANPKSTYYNVYKDVGAPQFEAIRKRVASPAPSVAPVTTQDPAARLAELRAKAGK